jgi:outer membrane lipoprotein-sorting protein
VKRGILDLSWERVSFFSSVKRWYTEKIIRIMNAYMKNILNMLGLVGVTVLLSGCSLGGSPKEGEVSLPIAEQKQTQEQVQQQSGPAEWIAGLAGGKRMQCTYTMKGEGDQVSVIRMYAEKDRYKTEMEIPAGMMVSLFDGKAMYSWMRGTKQGTKMEMECMKELGEQSEEDEATPVQNTYDSPEQVIESMPDISCSELGSTIDFSVPSDVEFSDQCAMLKKTMEQMKGLQTMPGNIPDMPVDIPENVKGMMGR